MLNQKSPFPAKRRKYLKLFMIYLIWRTKIDHMLQFDAGLRTICSIYIFKTLQAKIYMIIKNKQRLFSFYMFNKISIDQNELLIFSLSRREIHGAQISLEAR